MASARELSGKSDFSSEDILNGIKKINGKKQIKTSEENIKALKEGYAEYERDSTITLEKVNKKVKIAAWIIEDLAEDIKDKKSYQMEDYLKKVSDSIEVVSKFLSKKGKSQNEDEVKKLSALLSQAEAVVSIEKQLMDISTKNIINESTKNSLKLQVKENIFSESLKKYYIAKISKLVSFTETDEKDADDLENEFENIENNELSGEDFDEENSYSTKPSKLSRFVTFSKDAIDKAREGKLGKITRTRIRIDNLNSKLNDKHITSAELEDEISKIESLLKSKKAIFKSDKEDKAVQEKRIKGLKLKLAEIKEREKQEEKEQKEKLAREKQQRELEEKNRKNIAQYNQILLNFERKPNINNYNVILEKIKLNKDNKEIFENEEAYEAKLKEVEDLHNLFVQRIEESLYKSLVDEPLNFEKIDLIDEEKYSINFLFAVGNVVSSMVIGLEEAESELGKEKSDIIFKKMYENLKEFLENEIKEISKRDTDKGRELYAENLKRQVSKRKFLFKTTEELNEYLKRIEEAKNNFKTDDNWEDFCEDDDELEIEIQNRLQKIIDNPTYAEIQSLNDELETNKVYLNVVFSGSINRKLTELYENLVNKDLKQIEESPSVESIEKLLNNMNLVNLYSPNLSEIEEKLNQMKEQLNKKSMDDEIKQKITDLSLNPNYTEINNFFEELESNKDNLSERIFTFAKERLDYLMYRIIDDDIKNLNNPTKEEIENLIDKIKNYKNYYNAHDLFSLSLSTLNQMKEQLNKKFSEDNTIEEIIKDIEEAMNTARSNPTKENIENARKEINKYKRQIFSNSSLKKNSADSLLQELDNLSKSAFNENVYGNESNYEQYDRIIGVKTSAMDDLYEKLGEIEYNIHLLEGQFIAPEQKQNRLKLLNAQKAKIELEMSEIKQQIERYENLKEDKKSKNNYYDNLFKGVSHLTDEQLAAGVKQNMSYEELAEISRNLEKAEKLTSASNEVSKKDISESAYENITQSISSALKTRLDNPQLAKELIEKANSIFNQNYYVYSESQREQLNEYLQTATNMIDEEIYKNSGSVLK